MYRDEGNEDLRTEIYRLKKHLTQVTSENHLMKVKLRKLQDEINKKDKQMDSLFNPKNFQLQTANFHKIICERSASFLLSMKERNDKLQKALDDKDKTIKRLQNNLQIAKLYATSNSKNNKNELDLKKFSKSRNRKSSSADSREEKSNCESCEAKNKTNLHGKPLNLLDFENLSSLIEHSDELISTKSNSLRDQYKSLSKDHLLSIIENLKSNGGSPISQHRPNSSSRKMNNSPESDLDRFELLCESPHEEIQQLHQHFVEMLNEIDYLKNTITQLQNHQAETESALKEKGDNIGKLAEQIKGLKKPKRTNKKNPNTNSSSNNHLITNIYSSQTMRNRKNNNTSILCRKKETKPIQMISRLTTTSDIEEGNSNTGEEYDNQIKYVKKDSIFIVKKDVTSQTTIAEIGNKISDREGSESEILSEIESN